MQEPKNVNRPGGKSGQDRKDKVKYAAAGGPTIEAVLNQLFRFETEEQAYARITALKNTFIVSKDQEPDGKSLKLWIRNFSLSEDELKEGYKGHFAMIKAKKTGDGKFTVYAEKIETPLKNHPQKVRQKQKHPDWGNPVLRKVKRKHIYKTLPEAQVDFDALHQEYPETSIPGVNKLFIMIYEKTENREKQAPVRKFVLEVKPEEKGGGFFIHWQLNDKAERKDKINNVMGKTKDGASAVASVPGQGAAPAQPKGYFTAMVELKKKRKPGRALPAKPEKPENPTS